MVKTTYLFIMSLLLSDHFALGQTMFTIQQAQEDLKFYKSKLERYHPNLYLYSAKSQMDNFFDSLIFSIKQPITEFDFYNKVTQTSRMVKDGHTLILYSNSFVEKQNLTGKFIPLQVGIYDNKLYVKKNLTNFKWINEGTLIDSINGVSSYTIIQELLNRQVRDGNNLSYALWILDTYFREYYSYTYGHPTTYQLAIASNDSSQIIHLSALSKDSIYYYQDINYPTQNQNVQSNKAIYCHYDSTGRTAILTIKDFHSNLLKSVYGQNFKKEIKPILNQLIQNKAENLIIDLRDNQGGNIKYSIYLLSYLLDKPFKVVNEYQKLKKNKLKKCNGPYLGYHQPAKHQFKGRIYVLINGGCFSNSVIFSSCLRENAPVVFVGTETGGNPNVLGAFTKNYELPNTKLKVEIPTKRFILTSLELNDGQGLKPTYIIKKSIQDNIVSFDKELAFIFELIKKDENNGR